MRFRLSTNGNGYEQFLTDENDCLNHHRVLLFAWGELDSVFFTDDAREVHHEIGVEWYNTQSNLTALTPVEHREQDEGRARIHAPWDDLDGVGSA